MATNIQVLDSTNLGNNGMGLVSFISKEKKVADFTVADLAKVDTLYNMTDGSKLKTSLPNYVAFQQLTATKSSLINIPLQKSNVITLPTPYGVLEYKQMIEAADDKIRVEDSHEGDSEVGADGAVIWVLVNRNLQPYTVITFNVFEKNASLMVSPDHKVQPYGAHWKVPFILPSENVKVFNNKWLQKGREAFITNHPQGEYSRRLRGIDPLNGGKEITRRFYGDGHTGVEVGWTAYADSVEIAGSLLTENINLPDTYGDDFGDMNVIIAPYKMDGGKMAIMPNSKMRTSSLLKYLAIKTAIKHQNHKLIFSPFVEYQGEDGVVRSNAGYWTQILNFAKIIRYKTKNQLKYALIEASEYIMRGNPSNLHYDEITIPLTAGRRFIQTVEAMYGDYFKANNTFMLDGNLLGGGSKILTPYSGGYSYTPIRIMQAPLPNIGRLEMTHEPSFDHIMGDTTSMMLDGDSLTSWMAIVPSCKDIFLKNLTSRGKRIEINTKAVLEQAAKGGNTYLVKDQRPLISTNDINGSAFMGQGHLASSTGLKSQFSVLTTGSILVSDPSDVLVILPQTAGNGYN